MEMRARVGVLGNFGDVAETHDGQTLRTRMLHQQLVHRLGPARVERVDTAALPRGAPSTLLAILQMFRRCDMVLLMPGQRGLRVLLPFLLLLRSIHPRALHYLVVGGWLPGFLATRPWLRQALRRLDSLHVQSQRMVEQLQAFGFRQVYLFPNFREFESAPERPRSPGPLRLTFLSRVIPEKGVQSAVEAVCALNRDRGPGAVTLDIYGPVPESLREWFAGLIRDADPGVVWHGPLPQSQVVDTLADYEALLFPTWYEGEGFPGVIVEAYGAGVPVLATNWQDNAEVVAHERSGLLFPVRNDNALRAAIARLLDEPGLLERLKAGAREEACRFHVDVVIPPLLERLGLQAVDAA